MSHKGQVTECSSVLLTPQGIFWNKQDLLSLLSRISLASPTCAYTNSHKVRENLLYLQKFGKYFSSSKEAVVKLLFFAIFYYRSIFKLMFHWLEKQYLLHQFKPPSTVTLFPLKLSKFKLSRQHTRRLITYFPKGGWLTYILILCSMQEILS